MWKLPHDAFNHRSYWKDERRIAIESCRLPVTIIMFQPALRNSYLFSTNESYQLWNVLHHKATRHYCEMRNTFKCNLIHYKQQYEWDEAHIEFTDRCESTPKLYKFEMKRISHQYSTRLSKKIYTFDAHADWCYSVSIWRITSAMFSTVHCNCSGTQTFFSWPICEIFIP